MFEHVAKIRHTFCDNQKNDMHYFKIKLLAICYHNKIYENELHIKLYVTLVFACASQISIFHWNIFSPIIPSTMSLGDFFAKSTAYTFQKSETPRYVLRSWPRRFAGDDVTLSLPITFLSRLCLSQSRWPSCCTTHWIQPLHNTNSKSHAANYQSVHLTSQLSKIIKRTRLAVRKHKEAKHNGI